VLSVRQEAYTGTDLEHQKELLACIDDVKTGVAKVIVAYSYDRLSRDPTMQTVALYDIENKYGGRFEAVTDQLDRNSPMFVALRAMFGVADGLERKHVVERMLRGKIGRSQRGGLYGAANAKYGFRWVDDTPGERKTFEIDPANAETVRRIFDWFDNGKSIWWIYRRAETR
jgi:DNA invertase Pin-like site-specific DNA recombinase